MPTILVVDDEQLIRWSLTTRLTEEGYRVLEAETAAQALERRREGVDRFSSITNCPTPTGSAF